MRFRLLTVLALASLSACGPSGPATMEFVDITPPQPRIGDVVTVRFKLLDYRGLPLAGAGVDFKLQSEKAGVELSPRSVTSLKGSGYAETQVIASARVNSVIVVATSGDKEVISPPITFAGTVPSGRQFTFECGEISGSASGGRHAIGAYDQSRHLIAGVKLDCFAHTGDRNGNGVAGALVSFLTEAGAIGPTETSTSDVIGNAGILYKTSLPLPLDVPPDLFSWTPINDTTHTGAYLAPLWMQPFNWVENPLTLAMTAPASRVYTLREPRRPDPIRQKADGTGHPENNCRDNLVTMIAVTSGEEGFTDANNNGVYDSGEPFDDLTEPFVDSNDSGTWDPDERFIDINGNRIWDGKNDRWDANTLIWVEEKLLWTGIPAFEDTIDIVPGVQGHRKVFAPVAPARIDLRCPPGGGSCAQAGVPHPSDPNVYVPVQVTAYVADPWFNSMAQNSDSDACDIVPDDKAPIALKNRVNSGIKFTYPAGDYLSFAIGDKRDPNVPPAEQVPRRSPPIGFQNIIFCEFSASPLDGHIVRMGVGNVFGTIE
ncbi:MAG: hypothetical protein AB1938_30390 [Myxococcota bacterium]